MKKILIADDDHKVLKGYLEITGKNVCDYEYSCAATPTECLQMFQRDSFDAILLDISFTSNGKEGIAVLQKVKSKNKDMPVIMLSSLDDNEVISTCMRMGANDFISKSNVDGFDDIIPKLNNVFEKIKSTEIKIDEGIKIAKQHSCIAESEPMKKVFREVAVAIENPKQHVLLEGETGVGKDKVAFAISNPNRPFVVFNCACVSESLADSQLFGHVKGAFTGADRTLTGKFEQADGGDLFLDEIARLSLEVQGKLLRVLQSGDMYKLGSSQKTNVSVRVIAATNENLKGLIDKGLFREDLYQRLKKISIDIPPLRNRRSDIVPLVNNFVKKFQHREIKISKDLLNYFVNYEWPGNIRELENTIEYMVCNSQDRNFTFKDLPIHFFSSPATDKESDKNWRFTVEPGTPIKIAREKFEKEYVKHLIRINFTDKNKKVTVRELAKVIGLSKSTISKYASIIESHGV